MICSCIMNVQTYKLTYKITCMFNRRHTQTYKTTYNLYIKILFLTV